MSAVRFVPKAEIDRLRFAIKDPYLRCRALAQACRINTLSMIMYAGSGHIGTSFSSMDLLCWLWTQELRDPAAHAHEQGDLFFSSKGHDVPGLYSVLIALGKLDAKNLTKLRRLDGLPGHPDVGTPYMITNTGPLGMGISKARGMALADRLDGRRGRIVVLTGDGELQEGQFWESLQPTVNGEFSEITVIIDHNKMQSDTFVTDVSDLGDLEAKLGAFGFAVARCDGHDFRAIEASLSKLSDAGPRPRVLIADTVKGKGVSFMEGPAVGEDKLYKFHSGAPSAEHYAAGIEELCNDVNALLGAAGTVPLALEPVAIPPRWAPQNPERLVNAYADELVQLGRKHPKIVALDGDLMVDCGALPFKREFPERFVECGIAEQDMVSQAGALALKGKLPIVHSFACFLSTRPNEQLYNNATERTKVIYHASLAGLLPAAPGHSHQSVRDISAVGSIPGLTLIHPANEIETRHALRWAVEENAGSTYLRLTTVPCSIPYRLPDDYALVMGRGTVLRAGADGVIIAYGPVMLSEAFKAAEALAERGKSLSVVDLPWLNRVDPTWLEELLRNHSRLFLIEDHYPELGQSAFITQALCRSGIGIRTRIYGVEEIPICAQVPDALEHHGLSAKRLAERIWAEILSVAAEAPLPKSLKAVLGGEAKDALVFGAANFLRKFGGFFLVPLYMRRLSPEDYGVLAVVTMVGSIQGLLGSGSLELSITRFFYEWTDEDRGRNLGAIWVWNWITTLACTALFLLVLPFATPFLFPEVSFYPYLWLGIIANALGDLFVVPASIIRIKRLPWLFALYSFTSFGLSTGFGIWFVVVRDEKLMGYLHAMTWSSGLMALFGAAVMFAYARPCLTSPGLREAVRFALPAIPSNLIGTVGALLDRFLLNYFASLETLGLYSVAMKFVDVISSGVHSSLKMTFGPFMMKELAGDKEAGKATVAAITPFYMLPYFVAGLGLVYFVGPFLHIIDRPAYFPIIEAIPWLVGVAILGSLAFYYTNGIFLANRTGALWMPAAVQLLVLVLACALLIPPFEFAGLIASRYLSVIAFLAFSLYLSQKFYPIPHRWKTLLALAAAATVFALVNPWLKPSNPFLEAGLKVPFLAAFAGGAYWLLSRERQVVR